MDRCAPEEPVVVVVDAPLSQSSSPQTESLEFLSELAADALKRHETLTRTTASALMDTLENAVRLGWYLDDAKALLPAGCFGEWVTAHLRVSNAWVSHRIYSICNISADEFYLSE